MEEVLEQKREIFGQVRSLHKMVDFTDDNLLTDYDEQMMMLAEEFTELLHNAWKNLMGLEISLYDQLEEENLKFERILTDMVNNFIESAQGMFTNCRNLESRYMEQVNELSLKIMSLMNTPEEPSLPDELKAVSFIYIFTVHTFENYDFCRNY